MFQLVVNFVFSLYYTSSADHVPTKNVTPIARSSLRNQIIERFAVILLYAVERVRFLLCVQGQGQVLYRPGHGFLCHHHLIYHLLHFVHLPPNILLGSLFQLTLILLGY